MLVPMKEYKNHSCAPNVKEFCQDYIDGKLEAAVAIVNFSGMLTAAPGIGAPPCCTDYAGFIDDVQIYNAALPSATIQQLYAEGLKKHQTPWDHPDSGVGDTYPTLEAQVVNMADQIAYVYHDF